ncbi:MAG: SPASM domain-containing protein, partial [Planctomycetota bacterium]
ADREKYEKIRVGASFEKVSAAVEDLVRQRNERQSARPHIKANFIAVDEDDLAEKDKFIAYWGGKVNRIAVLRYLDCHTGDETLYHRANYDQSDEYCCPELWRRLAIVSDGTATLCPRDMKKEYVIGNVREQTVSEIWTGRRMEQARDLHRKGRFKELHKCRDCPDSYYSKRSAKRG